MWLRKLSLSSKDVARAAPAAAPESTGAPAPADMSADVNSHKQLFVEPQENPHKPFSAQAFQLDAKVAAALATPNAKRLREALDLGLAPYLLDFTGSSDDRIDDKMVSPGESERGFSTFVEVLSDLGIPRQNLHWRTAVRLPKLEDKFDEEQERTEKYHDSNQGDDTTADEIRKSSLNYLSDAEWYKRFVDGADESTEDETLREAEALLCLPVLTDLEAGAVVAALRARLPYWTAECHDRLTRCFAPSAETRPDEAREVATALIGNSDLRAEPDTASLHNNWGNDNLLLLIDAMVRVGHNENLALLITHGIVDCLVRVLAIGAAFCSGAWDGIVSTHHTRDTNFERTVERTLSQAYFFVTRLVGVLCHLVRPVATIGVLNKAAVLSAASTRRSLMDVSRIWVTCEKLFEILLTERETRNTATNGALELSAMSMHFLGCLCRHKDATSFPNDLMQNVCDQILEHEELLHFTSRFIVPHGQDRRNGTLDHNVHALHLRVTLLSLDVIAALVHYDALGTAALRKIRSAGILNRIPEAIRHYAAFLPAAGTMALLPLGRDRKSYLIPRSRFSVSILFERLFWICCDRSVNALGVRPDVMREVCLMVWRVFDCDFACNAWQAKAMQAMRDGYALVQYEVLRLCTRLIQLDAARAFDGLMLNDTRSSSFWNMIFGAFFLCLDSSIATHEVKMFRQLPDSICAFLVEEVALCTVRSNFPESVALSSTLRNLAQSLKKKERAFAKANCRALLAVAKAMTNIEQNRGLFQSEGRSHDRSDNLRPRVSCVESCCAALFVLGDVAMSFEHVVEVRLVIAECMIEIVADPVSASGMLLSDSIMGPLLAVLAEDEYQSIANADELSSSTGTLSKLKQLVLHLCVAIMRADSDLPLNISSTEVHLAGERGDMLLSHINQYLQVLTRSPPPSLPLLLGMLAGVRSVLAAHVDGSGGYSRSRQDLLRRASAIEKLTACLAQFPVGLDPSQKMRPVGATKLITPSQTDAIALTCELLPALTAILAGNVANKRHFDRFIGYDTLQHALEHVCGGNLSLIVLQLLLDMLVDGECEVTSFGKGGHSLELGDDGGGSGIAIIRNPHVVNLVVNLFPCFGYRERDFFLDALVQLLGNSTLNKSLCCNSHLGFSLLKLLDARMRECETSLIPQVALEYDQEFLQTGKIVRLLELVGTHSMPVRELKQLVGLLRAPWPREAPLLLKSLSDMATKRTSKTSTGLYSPTAFFNFDGADAKILLPGRFTFWPCENGYSVAFWLRLELTFGGDEPGQHHKLHARRTSRWTNASEGNQKRSVVAPLLPQCLVSCVSTDHDRGIIVSLTPARQLCVTYILSNSDDSSYPTRATEAFAAVALPIGRWHHIAIVHEPKRGLAGRAHLKLFVDGDSQARVASPLPPPALMTNLGSATVGFSPLFEEFSSFSGQMASVSVFDTALTSTQMTSFHSLGPDYSGSFVPGVGTPEFREAESIASDDVGTGLDSILKMSRLDRSCVLHLHSRACEGELIVDSAPLQQLLKYEHNARRDRSLDLTDSSSSVQSGTLSQVVVSVTRDIKDSIHCIGGMQALFPLVAQLAASAEMDLTDDLSEHARMLALIFGLLRDMLSNSHTNQRSMLQSNGIITVSFLLLRVPPALLTESLVDVVDTLARNITISDVQGDVLRHFFLDFRIWCYSSIAVQRHVLNCILRFISGAREFFLDEFGVQGFLDIIRKYYSPDEPHSVRPTGNALSVCRMLTGAELLELRSFLFACIAAVLGLSAENECGNANAHTESLQMDAASSFALMEFVTADIASVLVAETLRFFLSHGALLEKLLEQGGVEVWAALLRNDSEEVRLLAIQVVTRAIERFHDPKRSRAGNLVEQSGEISGSFIAAPSLLEDEYQLPSRDLDFAPIQRSLLTYPCSSPTLQVVFAVMLRDIVGPTPSKELSIAGRVRSHRANAKTHAARIEFGGMLPVLLKLLVGTVRELQLHCLQELRRLVTPASAIESDVDDRSVADDVADLNRRAFLRFAGWQNWFFALIADDESSHDTAGTLSEAVLGIVARILAETVCREKNGWRAVEESLYMLQPFGQRGVINTAAVTRILLCNILQILADFPVRLQHQSGKTQVSSSRRSLVAGFRRSILRHHEDHSLWPPSAVLKSGVCCVLAIAKEFIDGMWEASARKPNHALQDPQRASDGLTWRRRRHSTCIDGKWHDRSLVLILLKVVDDWGLQSVAMSATSSTAPRQSYPGEMSLLVLDTCLQMIHASIQSTDLASLNMAIERTKSMLLLTLDTSASLEVGVIANQFQKAQFSLEHVIHICTSAAENAGSSVELDIALELLRTLLRHCRPWIGVQIARGDKLADEHIAPHQQEAFVGWLNVVCTSDISIETIRQNMPRWNALRNFLSAHLQDLLLQVENYHVLLAKRIELEAGWCEESVERAEVYAIEHEKLIEDAALKLHRQLRDSDVRRMGASAQAEDELASQLARQWKLLLRAVKNERGPWSVRYAVQSAQATLLQHHWKLDKTENTSRMRLKLKRDYNFNPHSGAAIDDATVSSPPNQRVEGDPTGGAPVEDQTYEAHDWLVTANTSVVLSAPAPRTLTGAKSAAKELSRQATVRFLSESLSRGSVETSSAVDDKFLLECDAELVTPTGAQRGSLTVSASLLHFHAKLWDGQRANIKELQSKRSTTGFIHSLDDEGGAMVRKLDYFWPVRELREMHGRRYLLRRSALECFLVDQTNFFLNFTSEKVRNAVHKKIESLQPPALAFSDCRTPEQILKRSNLTQRWQRGEITNFDYLMQLNTIAGRTFNDLTQYPVFPWILSEDAYASDRLDLSDPKMFRDLSKPVGALQPARVHQFVERFEAWEDPTGIIPAFHYGSHYSSALTVLWYLVRLEPFTTLFLELQGGRFDHPDRMFFGIANAFFNNTHGSADVKELIPEFFCLPEFLEKPRALRLGIKQDGTELGDVELPKWANGSACEFVRLHRAALESPYVSQHLHQWIDLIFGYKQRGQRAVEAVNVFYYLTYEGSVNLDSITSEKERKATIAQIRHFGQTPSQLLADKPHPARDLLMTQEVNATLFDAEKLEADFIQVASPDAAATESLDSCLLATGMETGLIFVACRIAARTGALQLATAIGVERVVTVDAFRVPAAHRWVPDSAMSSAFELDPMTRSRLRSPTVSIAKPGSFAVSPDGRILYACGHAAKDHAFHVVSVDTGSPIQVISRHKDVVTALALDGKMLVTGSRDTTLMVWQVAPETGYRVHCGAAGLPLPLHVLYGHDDEVTSIALSTELDVVLSGSLDGSAIIYALRQGKYVRSIYHEERLPIDAVAIARDSTLVLLCSSDLTMHFYNINARPLRTLNLNERLNHFIISDDSKYIVSGGNKGIAVVRCLADLSEVHKFSTRAGIACFALSSSGRNMLVALQDGKLLLLSGVSAATATLTA